jgi:hypothetical protein
MKGCYICIYMNYSHSSLRIGQLNESYAVERPIIAGSKCIANLRLHFISELKRLTATSQVEYINGNVFRTIVNSKIEIVSLGQYTMWQEAVQICAHYRQN